MKLVKQIQEAGLFGVADSLAKKIPLVYGGPENADLYKGTAYRQVTNKLMEIGLTEYQISLLEDSVEGMMPSGGGGARKAYSIQNLNRLQAPIEAIKNLQRFDMITSGRDGYHWWLTKDGETWRVTLRREKAEADAAMLNKKPNGPVNDDPMDISWTRDGLMTTCSKLWHVWNNKDEILERAQAKQYLEFLQGHAEIEEAQKMIATSSQRVATRLAAQVPAPYVSTWTEEEQRAMNDLYWMTDGIAFWHNPRGILADPTPKPDWWTPPQDYKSVTAARIEASLNDVVERSLQAPKGYEAPSLVLEQQCQPSIEFVPASKEEITVHRANKVWAEIFETLCSKAMLVYVSNHEIDLDTHLRDLLPPRHRGPNDQYMDVMGLMEHEYGVKFTTAIFQYGTIEEITNHVHKLVMAKMEHTGARDLRARLRDRYLYMVLTKSGRVMAFKSVNSAVDWTSKSNAVQTVARWDTVTYRELLEQFIEQEGLNDERNLALDEILESLANMEPKTQDINDLLKEIEEDTTVKADTFKEWEAKFTPYEHQKKRITTGAPRNFTVVETGNNGQLIHQVRYQESVKGFDSKIEADTYLGEQRTFAKQAKQARTADDLKMEMQKIKAQKPQRPGPQYLSM